MKKTLVKLVMTLVAGLFLQSCRLMGQDQGTLPSKPENSKYDYEMSPSELEKLSKEIMTLKIGESRLKVKNLLGEPTHEQEWTGKDIDSPVKFRTLSYYVKIWEKGFVNEKHDKLVDLLFDPDDRLESITSNVEGIKSRSKDDDFVK